MHFLAPITILLTTLAPLALSQAAAGGGGPATVIQATQDSTIREAPSIFTVNGVTSVTRIMFTQTFATTALGTWDLGPTPRAGTIGLGDIQGNVGNVQSTQNAKRDMWAVPTRWGW